MKTIRKLLVANRSEIAIRVFRTAHELGIRTVAIYSHEDRYALHRFKADEAYLGRQAGRADSGVSRHRRHHRHWPSRTTSTPFIPATAFCPRIRPFAGPATTRASPSSARAPSCSSSSATRRPPASIAEQAGVPILPGSPQADRQPRPRRSKLADKLGYPGDSQGGQRRRRPRHARRARQPTDLPPHLEQAQRESLAAFGSPEVFVEKFIARARHIEVQLLGDQHGNLVHLCERDCSVQRRHQKVVEIAPAPNLDPGLRRQALRRGARDRPGRALRERRHGRVPASTSTPNEFYFIEVNPRIQVEHTVTEEVTGIDIVEVADSRRPRACRSTDPEIGLAPQDEIATQRLCHPVPRDDRRSANNVSCPTTAGSPHYRSASGMGIRLDAGTAFSGAVVTPFYDSLLVKVTARGTRLHRRRRGGWSAACRNSAFAA